MGSFNESGFPKGDNDLFNRLEEETLFDKKEKTNHLLSPLIESMFEDYDGSITFQND